MGEDYDFLFKCVVVGDGGVGKTALTLRFSKGFFTEDYKMTIGVDFHVKTIKVDSDGENLAAKLQIWDTGGQERFSSIRPMYYRGSLGALLIFDLTSMASFEHLPQWIEEVRANVQTDIPLLLVGNKSDLEDQREVGLAEINKFTNKFNLFYMETSAKTGEGVGDCFSVLAHLMIDQSVPDALVAEDTVFAPGEVLGKEAKPPAPQETVVSSESPEIDFETPSIPESNSDFTPEEEYEFDAPPIPEPSRSTKNVPSEPETQISSENEPTKSKKMGSAVIFNDDEIEQPEMDYEYDAPPVPETTSGFKPEAESQPEPEIPLPSDELKTPSQSEIKGSSTGSGEFEFKMPDEIIDTEEGSKVPSFTTNVTSDIKTTETDSFKPKSVPFATSTPEPTTAPNEFQASQEAPSQESQQKKTSLFFPSKSSSNDQQSKTSDSLVDYLPKPMFEGEGKKKKKKKKEKKKKKKKKDKKKDLEKEREEQQNLFQKMKGVGKKEKETQAPGTTMPKSESAQEPEQSALFNTLLSRKEKEKTESSGFFVPFQSKKGDEKTEEDKTEKKESDLRIIPNVEDFEATTTKEPSLSTPSQEPKKTSPGFVQPPVQTREQNTPKKSKTKTVICPSCGAVLSSEYSFCNRCGNKL